MSRAQLKRRQLLRGSLLAAAAIPLLDATRARGQAVTFPRRLLIFYTPNGTIGAQFRPTGGETDFTLGRILQPLAPYREQLLVLGGVHMPLADAGFGSHHTRGVGGLLTGRPILEGTFESAGPPTAGWASGISLDQHIAKVLAPPTPFQTLELGVQVVDAEVRGRLCYAGPSQPLPPIESPYAAFDRIFAGVTPGATDPALAARRLRRETVLGLVREELGDARSKVGAEDRAKLDQHLTSIQDIERRLTGALPVGSSGCAPPAVGAPLDVQAPENMPAIGALHMDMLAAAFACDLTRIATLQWTHAESDHAFPWLGIEQAHHAMSHAGDGDAAAQESLSKINVWYAEQLAYLLGKLASYPEGDGTLLDNTVVLWCNEVGKGNNHDHRNLPFLLAGSCGGHFSTGRFVDYSASGGAGHPHNNLLVSLANALGTDDTTFGDPAHCTGPLPGLT
jgi:Protein of unknown function (DUF1552)